MELTTTSPFSRAIVVGGYNRLTGVPQRGRGGRGGIRLSAASGSRAWNGNDQGRPSSVLLVSVATIADWDQ